MASKSPADLPFILSDVTVRHRGSETSAMVVTPKKPMVFGRDRLADLTKPSGLSPVELWLIDQARKRGEGSRLVLFRAMNASSERVWLFDPSLSERELQEAGYLLTTALLPFHRQLMAAGVVLMVHTDWGTRECYAMRHGVVKRADELSAVRGRSPEQELDFWILKNMLLHVALSLDHVVERLLPGHIPMIERRWPRVQELVSAASN